MAGQDDLAELEAERDRLRSMIAYHDRAFFSLPQGRAPAWFVVIAVAIICTIGISIVSGVLAGQISASGFLFLVVGLPLFAYILSREITIFGLTFHAIQILLSEDRRLESPKSVSVLPIVRHELRN
jgi:hypothetical protein